MKKKLISNKILLIFEPTHLKPEMNNI